VPRRTDDSFAVDVVDAAVRLLFLILETTNTVATLLGLLLDQTVLFDDSKMIQK
jgi:hypothetical protein